MKRIVLFLIAVFCATLRIPAITVEIEWVLDTPPEKIGAYGVVSTAFTDNGELIVVSNNGLNIYVLKDSQWYPLIESYKTEIYNMIREQRMKDNQYGRGYNGLVDSNVNGEFLYYICTHSYPQENYRIFMDSSGTIRAEWVSQEYFEEHQTVKFSYKGNFESGYELQYGIRIKFTLDKDGTNMLYPEIVDADGQTLFRVSDRFREGFVEDLRSFTINPALDRVAMVVSFRPERTSPYYTPAMPRLKKLVILKINYDQKAEENPPQPILEEPEEKRVEAPKVSSPEAEWWPPGYITEDNVRLRTAPNLEGKILRLLKRGEKVTVLAMDPTPMGIGEHTANWYKVRTEGGDVGWMYGWYLSWTPYPRTPSADELKPKAEPEGRD